MTVALLPMPPLMPPPAPRPTRLDRHF